MQAQTELDAALQLRYRFDVHADPEGGYVIDYPDLPGCMTQVDTIEEVGSAAREIFELWVEAALDTGIDIPEPSHPETYSGKFVLRLPKSLHRRLAERAGIENVSLNHLAATLLAESIGRLSATRQPSNPSWRQSVVRRERPCGGSPCDSGC
jgi:predicted RNase H-like HicB family nuclease